MHIIKLPNDTTSLPPVCLSIGVFDGVHAGHKKLLQSVIVKSKELSLQSAVLTFNPSPKQYFKNEGNPKNLSTLEEKMNLFQKLGLDFCFIQKFDEKFSQIEAKEYVQNYLLNSLKARHICIGYDHVFGKGGMGNFAVLRELCSINEVEVERISAKEFSGHIISTSLIKKNLLQGNMELSNAMLGHPYFFSGRIIHGKKLGRTLGYPTANVEVNSEKFLPKNGAYIVKCLVKNAQYQGMMSVGTNPTVNGSELSVEVHILDINQDLYGEILYVEILKFLHDEIKFSSLEELVQQLDQDKTDTLAYFK